MVDTAIMNLEIEKDRTFSLAFQLFNDAAGTTKDLTGYSVKMQIRPFAGSSTVLAEYSTSNGAIIIPSPASQGNISLVLTPAQTNAFTFTQAVYDMIISQAGVVTEIIEGNVMILSNITSSI